MDTLPLPDGGTEDCTVCNNTGIDRKGNPCTCGR